MSVALVSAKLWLLPDRATVRANARSIVALDLGQVTPGRKPTPAFFAELPNLPFLETLGFADAGMRAVPATVTACKKLEVLSLHSAGIRTLPSDLHQLGALRGLDLAFDKVGDAVEKDVGRWSALEVLEWPWRDVPASVLDLKKLRHIDVSDAKGTVDVPATLDSFATRTATPKIDHCPLRFFEGDISALPRSSSTLEHVSLFGKGELPADLKRMKCLRSLRYVGDSGLPDWLADLELSFLHLRTKRLGTDPDAFRVIERMTSLRGLVLASYELAGLPYDLSKLRDLRFLSIPHDAVKGEADFPRGLAKLPKLAMVQLDSPRKGPTTKLLREKHLPPGVVVREDGNMLVRQRAVDIHRAFSTDRSAPEWWLSRFRIGDVFDAIVEIGKVVFGA